MKAQIPAARFKIEEHFERALLATQGEATGAFLDENFKQQMEACMARLRATSMRYSQVDKLWRQTAQRRQKAILQLRRTMRDYIHVLRRRVAREGKPELTQFFTLPKTLEGEKVPWIAYAEKLLEGARRAEAAGIPPVTNPDSAELAASLAEVRAVQSELDGVFQELSEARKEHQAMERECGFRLRELRLKLLETGNVRNRVEQRMLLRTYGYGVDASRRPKDDPPQEDKRRFEEVMDQNPFLALSTS